MLAKMFLLITRVNCQTCVWGILVLLVLMVVLLMIRFSQEEHANSSPRNNKNKE